MAKKISQTMKVTLEKNTTVERGGAWLLGIAIHEEGASFTAYHEMSAWANPSAAKRHIKEIVQHYTPRKSIKLNVDKLDTNDKPVSISGELAYKVER